MKFDITLPKHLALFLLEAKRMSGIEQITVPVRVVELRTYSGHAVRTSKFNQ